MADRPLPAVKICGLTRRADAIEAAEAGADYLGVVLSAGFVRSVVPGEAGALVRGLDPVSVAVLVDETLEDAIRAGAAVAAGVLQLHGDEPPELLAALRAEGPWRLWKAVRVASASDLDRAVARYAAVADGLLVEGYRPGVVGGGGVRVDPASAADVRNGVPPSLTLVLAGGLTPENVGDAVDRFRPDVVDVSSGVESAPGVKAPDQLRRFVREARRRQGPPASEPLRQGDGP